MFRCGASAGSRANATGSACGWRESRSWDGDRNRDIPNALHGMPRKSELGARTVARYDSTDVSGEDLRRADHRSDESARGEPDGRSAKNAGDVPERAPARQLEGR